MTRILYLLTVLCFAVPSPAQSLQQSLDSAEHYRGVDFVRSIDFATRAQKLSRPGTPQSAKAAFLLGFGYYLSGQHDEALRWWLSAEREYETLRDTGSLVDVYNELCVLYLKQEKFPQALAINRLSLTLSADIHDINRLATAYNARGLYYNKVKDLDSAIIAYRQAYFHYKRLNNSVGMSYSLDYMASAYADKGMMGEARHYLESSMALHIQSGDKMGTAIVINNIGELLLQQKQPRKSLPYFRRARDSARAIHFKDLEANTWQMEAEAARQLGMFREAYEATTQYQNLHDELLNETRIKAIEDLNTRYQTDKKEQLNTLLVKENNLQALRLSRSNIVIMALGLVALLIGGISYLLYNRYRLRQQAKLNAEMLFQQQMRIAAVLEAEEVEKQRLARELHDGLGQMLAATRRHLARRQNEVTIDAGATPLYDEPLTLLDESIREVRQLSHSMMPPALRNKSLVQALQELAYRTEQSSGLDVHTDWGGAEGLALSKTESLMLYRTIQEIISNTIRHANASSLTIELVNHDTEITIMIYDNGDGFDKAAVLANGGGLGLKNIQSRIAFIGAHLELDTQPGSGTTYTIELPTNTLS